MTEVLRDDSKAASAVAGVPWAQVSPWVAAAEPSAKTAVGWYSKYRWLMTGSDMLAITAAVTSTFYLLFAPDTHLNGPFDVLYVWLAPIIIVLWVVLLGLNESRSRAVVGAGLEEYRRVMTGSFYVFGLLALISYVLQAQLSRALFVTTLPFGILLLVVGRWIVRQSLTQLRSHGRALTPTLVVGSGATVLDVVKELNRHAEAGYRPTGACVIDDDDAMVFEGAPGLRPVSVRRLHQVVRGDRYGAVIVADGLSRKDTQALAWRMENRPVELMFMPRAVDVAGPRLSVRSVEGLSLVHLDLPQFTGWRLVLKRTFDLAFSTLALLLLAPLFAVIAILIKLDDGGPVLFRQERVGRHGQPFVIHKFRTMCVDAEAKIDALIAASGGQALLFKLEDDPRITPIGKFLRKYSLDELPQFWSVLRGGMSVVGPRPQVSREVAEYTDIHYRRLLIKPGITGLWQVNGRSELSMEESVRLDLRYVENWSLIGDITIILKTVGVVFRTSGAF